MKSLLGKSFEKTPAWLKSVPFQIMICIVILFVVMRVSYVLTVFDYPYDYEVGDIVQSDIVLDEDYMDRAATELEREQARYAVEPIYSIDAGVYASAKTEIAEFYNKAYEIRLEYGEDEEFMARLFKHFLKDHYPLTPEDLEVLSSVEEHELRLSESYIYDVLKTILSQGVTDENIITQQNRAKGYFEHVDQLSQPVIESVIKIINQHVVVNSHIDEKATNERVEEAVRQVVPVVIPKGSMMAMAGEALSLEAYAYINEMNLNDRHTLEQDMPLYFMDATVALILILMAFVVNYHYNFKETLIKHKEVYLSFTIMIMMYLLTFGFGQVSMYLVPLGATGMLISILDDAYTGVIFSFFLTILYGVIHSVPLVFVVFTILSSMAAAMMVYKVFQRNKIFLAGLSVSVMNVLVVFAMMSLEGYSVKTMGRPLLFGALSGVLCSMITIGSLPLWEVVYKILTPIKLLEYANPNHPLMQQLLLEAPGTYHHSILVANLSEAAAHNIGANGLIARVGAYYHDIGKLDQPFLFVENQYDGQNPHDQLVPKVSAKIIKKHVTNGLKLGKQYKLPKEILDFIQAHHGTTLIQYFYHKAEGLVGDAVEKDAYRYPGPLPMTKEIAIVMLADSVEAAVRSVKNSDRDAIKALIQKIVQGKIKDHQLDESGLTLKEIDVITKAFIANLSTAFHERIEYPALKEASHLNQVK